MEGGQKRQHLLPDGQPPHCKIPQRTLDRWKAANDSFTDGKIFFERGRRGSSEGFLLMAVDSFELAMKNGMKNPDICKRLGDAYLLLSRLAMADGKQEAAEQHLASATTAYIRAVSQSPKDVGLHIELTWCFFITMDYERVFEHASAALELMPGSKEVRFARGIAAYELSRENGPEELFYFNRAFEDLSASLEAGCHFSKTYQMLADIYFARGEKDRASGFDSRAAIHRVAEKEMAASGLSIN